MQSRFTKKAQEALDHASEAAVMLGHSYIGSEHLLIGLIQTEECLASAVLAEYDVTDEKIINLDWNRTYSYFNNKRIRVRGCKASQYDRCKYQKIIC